MLTLNWIKLQVSKETDVNLKLANGCQNMDY